MNDCDHKWVRRSNDWIIFKCDTCGIIGYFKKLWNKSFKITPFVCQKAKCKNFVMKINSIGERYCNEHYIEKYHKDWAYIDGNRRHTSVNPEIYYENFTGEKKA